MQSTIIILLVFFDLYQSQQKKCICECCLDDNIHCIPTFRSAININPLLKCDDITCNQESCLTFSQCSIAFGKIVASCENVRAFSSSSARTTFGCVKATENNYSTSIIYLHTYTKAQNAITRTKINLGATNQGNISHSGPSSSTNTKKEITEEKVRCIPIEDIISVTYSTDSKEQYDTFETKQERARTIKRKLGCCGSIKKCLRETYCCCPKCPCAICKPPQEEAPNYDTNRRQNMTANRMILVEIKCISYSNIHIPSYVQVLPDDQKMKFYKENFDVDTIEFYLFNNNETDKNNFDAKRNEAEALCRVIVQLRNMVNHYPSPMELDEIIRQQEAALFGDEIRY